MTGGPAPRGATPDAAAGGEPGFDPGTSERSLDAEAPVRWIGWRRRALVLLALLGCIGLFSLSRWLAATPSIAARWAAGAGGELTLEASADAALAPYLGRDLVAVGPAPAASAAAPAMTAVDALLVHNSPRWQVDDAARARQLTQHAAWAAALASGRVRLQFADAGGSVDIAAQRRGWSGLGYAWWPLAALALAQLLAAGVVVLARPAARNALFLAVALCQTANLVFVACENLPGLGLPAGGAWSGSLPLRVALDLCTGAATLHAFALRPRRWLGLTLPAVLGWCTVLAWALLAGSGRLAPLWWWAQAGCLLLGAAAWAVTNRLQAPDSDTLARLDPYPRGMRRLALMALVALVLVTLAVAISARLPAAAPGVAAGASIAWYVLLSSLLLLTPFLARSREVLREFAMLAAISTVATALDLLFVAVFSLEPFTSLAVAVFIALALYAGARQWTVDHLVGSTVLTTERTFDRLYRAAREVQAQPARHAELLGGLLRELFEPLEVTRVDRVPVHARVVAGGAALVVPMRTGAADGDGTDTALPPASALALRHAHRGQRLFTVDDARLADRVVDQLRRAVAYDQAVERGRNEERTRIAQDLHDDIGARLLTLMYQAPTAEIENYIRHTLQDLKTLTRGLSSSSQHRLSDAAAEWKADIAQRLAAAGAELVWTYAEDRELALGAVQWSALTRMLRELVTNALYHGHATRVDVECRLQGPALTLRVADDGDGRAPASWAPGVGLNGVRKRARTLGGEVAWVDNGDRGIVCTVRVPAGSSGRTDAA